MLRPATADDYAAFGRLMLELGIHDPLPTLERFVERTMPRMTIATDGDDAIGYVTWRPYGPTAHVVQLVVDPAHRGRGIGHELLEFVRARAIEAGCANWYLNVKRDNARAIRVYEHVGFRTALESWALKVPWSIADAMEVDANVTSIAAGEDLDRPIAERFGMDRERIATLRTRPGSTAIALLEDNQPVAFCAFDPDFPGAVPFAMTRTSLAGALLRACRPYAHHDRFDFMRTLVEGDRAVAESLLVAGAELIFELLRLSASLVDGA